MGNDVRSAHGLSQPPSSGVLNDEPTEMGLATPVQVVRGRDNIARMRPLLVELCQRTGQTGAMDSLEYRLGAPSALGKMPYLVLLGIPPTLEINEAVAADVQGAVVLYEYRVAGQSMRVFITDDLTGRQTVIAPAELRAQVAQIAGRALIEQGALMALISLEGKMETDRSFLPARQSSPCHLAVRRRIMPRDLLTEDTIEATMASLGKRTRRNLRYYRRLAETHLGAIFVPEVEITREEFVEMNRTSTNPAPPADAAWRYECITGLEHTMFAGVRAADGRWLSLVGGRRIQGVTEIEWQMNRSGLPRYSLSTVMRSYLLEHEVALGATKLMFQGGTPHSMRHSLILSEALDILVMRRSSLAWVLRRCARWIFPRSNFLGSALLDKSLTWIQ
jgi:hypothetical protein